MSTIEYTHLQPAKICHHCSKGERWICCDKKCPERSCVTDNIKISQEALAWIPAGYMLLCWSVKTSPCAVSDHLILLPLLRRIRWGSQSVVNESIYSDFNPIIRTPLWFTCIQGLFLGHFLNYSLFPELITIWLWTRNPLPLILGATWMFSNSVFNMYCFCIPIIFKPLILFWQSWLRTSSQQENSTGCLNTNENMYWRWQQQLWMPAQIQIRSMNVS